VVFQSFIFGQILENFGSFGQIWADFPAFTVVHSMRELGLKSSKLHNFSIVSPMLHATAHWKATVLLHNQQMFHKIPKKITITAACPDHQKAILVYKDL
jgi:hypothetical protein